MRQKIRRPEKRTVAPTIKGAHPEKFKAAIKTKKVSRIFFI